MNERDYNALNFESIKIGLASPETIMGSAEEGKGWSYGEVTRAETINYRSLKPEADGLYCERIFGPQKDWECHCGKYKRIRYKGIVCRSCGVKVTRSKVRRERMGHIKLACAVSHIWYLKSTPSRMALLLDIAPSDLEHVVYFTKYVVTEVNDSSCAFSVGQVIGEKEFRDEAQRFPGDFGSFSKTKEDMRRDLEKAQKAIAEAEELGEEPPAMPEVKTPPFRACMGAEAILELLEMIDLDALTAQLKEAIADIPTEQKKAKLLKRLSIAEDFRASKNRPEWMILKAIPVIPPDLRPMVQLDGGRFATSDLNELYRRVINRNRRLKYLIEEITSPDIVIRNEKRMLQEAVDALIYNGKRGRPVTGANNRELRSLSHMLSGKQGRFRQNLLGKRVDYSGRSVIVVGPELKMYQCGLPKEMALELFKPFVMKLLVERKIAPNIKNARRMVDRVSDHVWDALEEVIKDHPVMLNRAPTLHRLGIQAFEPILVEGRAIKLHPLVCTAFNADFDGDQMAVHVPLSAEAQAEARFLMLASNNLLKPSDGKPVAVPSQDMVLGSYYLTLEIAGAKGEGKVFRSVNEAIMAYDEGDLDLHAKCKIRMTKDVEGKTVSKIIETTLGRIIFNEPIPQDLGIVDRADPENLFALEVDYLVEKKALGKIIDKVIKNKGIHTASEMLDRIKDNGYKYSTRSGITVSVFDALIPVNKPKYVAEAEEKVAKINESYRRGFAGEKDRLESTLKAWEVCTSKISSEITTGYSITNPIFMMVESGARGSKGQLNQLAGMRGLISSTSGKTIEIPIRANYREGLNILEYFIASRGARKGLADTALRTADSGYLTRRLVDVSQDVIIREEDCGCKEGLEVSEITDSNGGLIESLEERLEGRFLLEPFCDAETGEVIVDNDHMLTENDAKAIVSTGIRTVKIRSLLTCCSKEGVCVKCYGKNLATSKTVQIGEAVGTIAAQSIGEPGTQLTMRNFHNGGVASASDITQGLPRVEELFEARNPKPLAILSEKSGIVSIESKTKNNNTINTVTVTSETDVSDRKTYTIPYDSRLCVSNGMRINMGEPITEGSRNPNDILSILGANAVHNYLINEVQNVYRSQSVEINDKHIEVIVRQMMRKIKVTKAGSSDLIEGATVEKRDFIAAVTDIQNRIDAGETALELPEGDDVLLGITKASLATESFLSAASFQETAKVLTDAAIKGKTDALHGLKENVIIGKLLPSGTGMRCYNDVDIDTSGCDSID